MVAESFPVKRFTADEVLRMVEQGFLQDEHVELIEGELVIVPPQGPVHSSLTVGIRELLGARYGDGFHLRDHSTVRATPDSLPEPDIAVVRGDWRSYLTRLPTSADIVLVVEVSSTSRAMDRRKAAVYAQAGYAAYWLVDVNARRIEIRTQPESGEYLKTEIVDETAVLPLPGSAAHVKASELLP